MKRTTLCLLAGAAACAMPAVALGVDWADGFEDYACESDIVGQGGGFHGPWIEWAGAPSSDTALVSCASDGYVVHSGEKSLRGLGAGTPGNPGAGADDIVHQYSFINTGYWAYTAWVYVPSTINDGSSNYFILLNQFVVGGGAPTSWSTQLEMNPQRGVIESTTGWIGIDGPTLPLLTDQWVEIKVLINLFTDVEDPLGGDQQNIYYDGQLLETKGWTDGVGNPDGTLSIQAVDLWFNEVTLDYVHYDDMSLVELPPTGACCFEDGSCEVLSPTDCADGGGRTMGIGVPCESVDCPEIGDCGWMLTGPTSFSYTTVGRGDNCTFVSGSEDEQFEVTIPFTGWWIFSTCDGADWDTVLTLGTECCGFDLAVANDGCPSGLQSLMVIQSLSAGTYFLNLEDVGFNNGGPYTLLIDTPCIIDCPDGAYEEAEPCGADTNGGCNMDTPTFEPIELDLPICGEVYYDGATRDTDWYEIVFDDSYDYPLELTLSGTSEFVMVMGLSQYTEGTEGSGNCDDGTGYISPFARVDECMEGEVDISIPNEGIYWIFVSLDFNANDPFDCGEEDGYEDDYVVVLSLSAPDCPWDFDGDGDVDSSDLLFLLGAWGTPAGDTDGDGDTDTADLLGLLGHWGDCPE